jgi:hypothetical protein
VLLRLGNRGDLSGGVVHLDPFCLIQLRVCNSPTAKSSAEHGERPKRFGFGTLFDFSTAHLAITRKYRRCSLPDTYKATHANQRVRGILGFDRGVCIETLVITA